MAYSPAIQKLIEQFSKFPTVGPRTAARFVFYLLKLSKVGGKTAYKLAIALNKEARIASSIGEREMFNLLKTAINKGAVDALPGFGPKNQLNYFLQLRHMLGAKAKRSACSFLLPMRWRVRSSRMYRN